MLKVSSHLRMFSSTNPPYEAMGNPLSSMVVCSINNGDEIILTQPKNKVDELRFFVNEGLQAFALLTWPGKQNTDTFFIPSIKEFIISRYSEGPNGQSQGNQSEGFSTENTRKESTWNDSNTTNTSNSIQGKVLI